jgi:putative endonuclease
VARMDKDYDGYILASQRNGSLYVGITSNLIKRILKNRNKTMEDYTQKYNVD